MKFSTIASTMIGAALFFASKAVADVDYFDWPSPNAVFRTGTSIQFVVDEMPDGDDDERVYANLYRENGSFVKTIRSWDSDNVDDDEFAFTWYVDRNLRSGRYFVEIFADDDDDDDVSRSFIFEIASGAPTASSPSRYPTATNNNNRYRRPAMRNGRQVYRPARGGPKRMRNRYHKRAAGTC
ncbi:hypothetical protein V8B55DRAFT_1511474 [Mucor lusitanicus]|uniref:Secreted protein n=2 Tax=Mucor circinelloides f. lusitanicus TaxID=29924 RepID=A0A168GUL2_MUCCL|nr:hypothetical protein FB192DRAFT_1371387 [Mucor lusitanicus]OAC98037.1 hypothetical protein MUCCIDRAFT_157558 [Mucor lusitanicus CBS 277.49]